MQTSRSRALPLRANFSTPSPQGSGVFVCDSHFCCVFQRRYHSSEYTIQAEFELFYRLGRSGWGDIGHIYVILVEIGDCGGETVRKWGVWEWSSEVPMAHQSFSQGSILVT